MILLQKSMKMGLIAVPDKIRMFLCFFFCPRNFSGIIYVLYNLLIIEKNRNSISSYETTISGHPLVQILDHNSSYAKIILDVIKRDTPA